MTRRSEWVGTTAILLLYLNPVYAEMPAGESCLLQDHERIVFIGDSSTQNESYLANIEYYLMTRFPDRVFTIVDATEDLDTISTPAKPGPAQASVRDRFVTRVVPWKPDVLVVCYGMHDGGFQSASAADLELMRERYQSGIQELIQRAMQEASIKAIMVLTPPPFDPYYPGKEDPPDGF